jgi:hypothetical protein
MIPAAAKVTPREDVIDLAVDRGRWFTPIADYRTFEGRRVGVFGRARWHPDGTPSFDYLEFHLDDIDDLEPGDPDRADPRLPLPRRGLRGESDQGEESSSRWRRSVAGRVPERRRLPTRRAIR